MSTRNSRRLRAVTLGTALVSMMAAAAHASDSLQQSGFVLLRPQTPSSAGPFFEDDTVSAQVQMGIDWRPTPGLGASVHLLARNEGDHSRRGRVGVVQAYVEKNIFLTNDRARIMAGAFFLPTSRENVDSLWESPYTISSSALNSWLGQELRPIGVDLTYTRRTRRAGAFTGGGTLFRGNDTFGELLIGRGWSIVDRWTLLGEHALSRAGTYTSVSAETDGRLGWSGRAKWNNDRGAVQITRIDNRSDALRYGELANWATRFNIVGADYTWNDWTVVAESGWGSTAIVGRRGRSSSEIRASYLLLSRRIGAVRASIRGDEYSVRDDRRSAVTAAAFWEARPRLRVGVEVSSAESEERLALEFRHRF